MQVLKSKYAYLKADGSFRFLSLVETSFVSSSLKLARKFASRKVAVAARLADTKDPHKPWLVVIG